MLFAGKILKPIYSFAGYIKKPAEAFFADGNGNGAACCNNLHILMKALGSRKHNAPYNTRTDLLSNLHNQGFAF